MSNDMKWIERKSIAPIEPATGAVSDTLNVEDKVKNAPSINLVTQMTGIPQDGIIIYEGDEIPEGYEEINEGIDDTPTGAIIDWEDGVEIPEGWEETEGKSIVQVGYNGSTAFTVTTTNTKTFVPMAKQLSKIGNGFTVQSDGTVLVNKTMKIRAKAQVMLTASGTGAKILMIDINQYDWSYDRVVSLKDYVPLKSDTYILDVKQGDILRLYYQGDANDTFHTSTAFVYMYIEEINDPNKPIKKVAVTEVPKIEGSIVDGTNIDDKTTNTYSANIIDGLVSDSVKIEDISDTVINFNEGYSKATGFRIYKQGKRIFGCLNFQKSSNWTTANGDIEIGTINYKPPYGFYANMTTADYFWAIGVNGYLAIESTGKILVKVSDVSKKVIKSYIEFVTN